MRVFRYRSETVQQTAEADVYSVRSTSAFGLS
jgi:hypothetical protein